MLGEAEQAARIVHQHIGIENEQLGIRSVCPGGPGFG